MGIIEIIKAYFIESPLFEIVTEDGVGATYNLQVVAEAADGTKFTHEVTFVCWERAEAEAFAEKVAARGVINLDHWSEGTSWDHFATPQTYEEEKAEAYFNHGAAA